MGRCLIRLARLSKRAGCKCSPGTKAAHTLTAYVCFLRASTTAPIAAHPSALPTHLAGQDDLLEQAAQQLLLQRQRLLAARRLPSGGGKQLLSRCHRLGVGARGGAVASRLAGAAGQGSGTLGQRGGRACRQGCMTGGLLEQACVAGTQLAACSAASSAAGQAEASPHLIQAGTHLPLPAGMQSIQCAPAARYCRMT